MELLIPALFVFFAGLIIAAMIYGDQQAKKRREDLSRLARKLGLRYHADDPLNIANRYANVPLLAQGHNQSAYNVLHGRYGGHEIKAFDYVYHTTETSTDSQGRTTTREVAHHFSA